ncbi:MAG: hypothetical protein K9N23_02070 [Akkermansiaceae bacterium]|nr:hypothetical protein [Akkermansiaceae bacterium]MCF7730437.1 hypothetical protein [Akkermansiaceae bacterium]
MKSALITSIVAAAMVGSVGATTVTASGGTTGAQFITSAGTFLTPTNAVVSVGLLEANIFTMFATADATPINFGTAAILEGRWLGNAADTSVAANPFNGLQIWFKIETTADGGGVGYFSGGQNFPANGAGVGDSTTIGGASLNTINAGLSTPGTEAFNAGKGTTGQVTIGVVPESSVALLGALGALGLLRRRR